MLPLAAGLTLDVFLIAKLVLEDARGALSAALGLLFLLAGFWFVLPRVFRRVTRAGDK